MRDIAVLYPVINVTVCDPCPMFFSGLKKNFEADERVNIASESPSLREVHNRVSTGGVDIALVEWGMISWHDHACMKLVGEISSHAHLVLLGMSETTRDRKQALELGARGIVSKRSNGQQIRRALCRVAGGGIWLERSAAETLLNHVFLPSAGPDNELARIELLTAREREVIMLVCRSLRNKEIAADLSISESTVWHHLTSIFTKLKVTDRVSLVTFAFRHELNSCMDKASVAKPRSTPTTIPKPRANKEVLRTMRLPRPLDKLSA